MTPLRRLRQLCTRRRVDRERGATATIVAVFLAGGVIMGMLAVSVDLGNLTFERRQVQNAADATSMALASECAADETKCDPAIDDVKSLLGENSHDALGQYGSRPDAPNGVCARGTAEQVGLLSTVTCASAGGGGDITDLMSCPPLPDWLAAEVGIPYVESYAATLSDTGDALFLPFSRVLAGDASGDKGTSACARAAWGAPDGYKAALPLAISQCEWHTQVIDGDGYEEPPVGPKPGYDDVDPALPDWPSDEIEIIFHDDPKSTGCPTWKGLDFPGGFGWLTSGTTCEAEVTDDGWVQTKTGGPATTACKDLLPNLRGTVVDIPVFDCIVGDEGEASGEPAADVDCDSGKGANAWYHIAGWAKFYVSGYRFPSMPQSSYLGDVPCEPEKSCISGWFTTGALSDAPSIKAPGGPDDFGAYVIKPAG